MLAYGADLLSAEIDRTIERDMRGRDKERRIFASRRRDDDGLEKDDRYVTTNCA